MDQDWIVEDAKWKAKIEADLAVMTPHFRAEGTISKLTDMRTEFIFVKNMVKGIWGIFIAVGGIVAAWFGSKQH